MAKIVTIPICILLFVSGASASPITVGGFNFPAGEEAFGDHAVLAAGTIRFNCLGGGWGVTEPAESVSEALSGSDLSLCVNNDTGDSGVVEVLFLNNAILNGPGVDLVVFELSGAMPPGTPDPKENFGISIYDGVTFTPFSYFDPLATGTSFCGDPTLCLDTFSVQVELSDFGIPEGGLVHRVQLHIFDVGLGTKSADIGALGALNSIPEPSTFVLTLVGMVLLAGHGRRR
jgi:hypothetical protein